MAEDVPRRVGAEGVTPNLLDTLRALATFHGHAEVYQTPGGEYRMTGPDCITGSPVNRYVVAKPQLDDVLCALGVRLEEFVRDAAVTERVAVSVLDSPWRHASAPGYAS